MQQPMQMGQNAIMGGLQIGYGFSLSARPALIGPMVVIDSGAAAFVQAKPLLDLATDNIRGFNRGAPDWRAEGPRSREWKVFAKEVVKGLKARELCPKRNDVTFLAEALSCVGI